MKKQHIIKTNIDLTQPLSDEQKQRLTALKEMPDENVDFSDIAYNPNAKWVKSVDFNTKQKQQVTLRIDKDVLDFFKKTGKGYQTRLNSVLRTYMEAHQ
ncbi:MAG: BrnA antitoxin family protein [Neisseriaceae bacterium]|nr:BrnA antitoxin family protein [Neisseriaceae bacterium]